MTHGAPSLRGSGKFGTPWAHMQAASAVRLDLLEPLCESAPVVVVVSVVPTLATPSPDEPLQPAATSVRPARVAPATGQSPPIERRACAQLSRSGGGAGSPESLRRLSRKPLPRRMAQARFQAGYGPLRQLSEEHAGLSPASFRRVIDAALSDPQRPAL
jgi:hypothetical protein